MLMRTNAFNGRMLDESKMILAWLSLTSPLIAPKAALDLDDAVAPAIIEAATEGDLAEVPRIEHAAADRADSLKHEKTCLAKCRCDIPVQ